MMLKTFKWIYNLGYKKAEDRYYFALMEHVTMLVREQNMWPIDEGDKENRRRADQQQAFANELRRMVELVFNPTEYREVEPVNKFKP